MKNADYFWAYAVGVCNAGVCTNLDVDAATERLNAEHLTGVGPWELSEDKEFADGSPHPQPCPDTPGAGHRHLLFNCWHTPLLRPFSTHGDGV